MATHPVISESLALIFQGIHSLRSTFPGREFTIDGRLVGDIGEIIAAIEYDLVLDEKSQPGHDATSFGRRVQIKATFKDSLTFRTVPEYFIGLKIEMNGDYEEIYNGPGHIIEKQYGHRKGIGKTLLSFPNSRLAAMSKEIPPDQKISKREVTASK